MHRLMITLDDWSVEKLSEFSKAHSLTRSAAIRLLLHEHHKEHAKDWGRP